MFFKIIEKELQTELRRRELIMGRTVTTLPNGSGNVEFADYAAKTPYAIMCTNASDEKLNVALSYGEFGFLGGRQQILNRTQVVNDGNYDTSADNRGFTGASNGAYVSTQDGSEVGVRPVSGIKSVTCEYMGLNSVLRKADVTWSAPSLESLQQFEAFLTLQNEVAVQWGFQSPKTALDNNKSFIIIGNDRIQVNQKLYTQPRGLILAANGNMDALGGRVSNYSSKLRDDGGFDCTTEITAIGTNMFSATGKENVGGVGQILPKALQQEIKQAAEGMVGELLVDTYTEISSEVSDSLFGKAFGFRERTEEEKKVLQVSLQDHMLNAIINLDGIANYYGIKENAENGNNITGEDQRLSGVVNDSVKVTEKQKKEIKKKEDAELVSWERNKSAMGGRR